MNIYYSNETEKEFQAKKRCSDLIGDSLLNITYDSG